MGSDNREKRRSDRHNNEENQKQQKSKRRSDRHQHKINMLPKTLEKMRSQSKIKDVRFKTRMERYHHKEDDDEITEADDQTKKYIPARKLTKQETNKEAKKDATQRKTAEKRAGKEI